MRWLVTIFILCWSLFAFAEKTLNFYITVDLEGVDFHSEILHNSDLQKIIEFRRKFPNYPMVFFLNAAYYTNGSLNSEEVTKRLRSIIRPGDEIGLHLHPWESLVKASGVEFITGPTYFGKTQSPFQGVGNALFPKGHRGGDVPLWFYSKESIKKMLLYSLKVLAENGFDGIKSFRAGGWQSNQIALEAAQEVGLSVESSPVPYNLVENKYKGTPLANYVKGLWGEITPISQPRKLKLRNGHELMLWPNNAGLADYVEAKEFENIVQRNFDNALLKGKDAFDIVYGYHLETADEYLRHVEDSINLLEAWAIRNKINTNPTTISAQMKRMTSIVENSSSCSFHLAE